MSETYTKVDLIKELAEAANVSQRRIEITLETLTKIAYREARKGFAVPGICRLDVVPRKARLVRNPQTKQTLQIAAHDALRVRPVKSAKTAIAPVPRAVQVIAEPPATPAASAPTPPPPAAPKPYTTVPPPVTPKPYTTVPPPAKPSTPAAPPATPPPADDEQFISFRCKKCGQEIESPLEMIGTPNECPTCGETLMVPTTSEVGTIWHQVRATTPEIASSTTPSAIAAMKGRTIRIELPDDL